MRLPGWLGGRARPALGMRWAVVDCETSGLDAARDRLLSVAGVALRGGRIDPADAFAALVGQAEPSERANILVHGIGGDAQRAARPAAAVLGEFTAWLGDAVPVAFNAPFDAEMLRRALARAGVAARLPRRWLDLALLAPALAPERARQRRTLDDWLAEYGIDPGRRHDALADAYASAQLLQVLLARAARQGAATDAAVLRAAGAGRWLGLS